MQEYTRLYALTLCDSRTIQWSSLLHLKPIFIWQKRNISC